MSQAGVDLRSRPGVRPREVQLSPNGVGLRIAARARKSHVSPDGGVVRIAAARARGIRLAPVGVDLRIATERARERPTIDLISGNCITVRMKPDVPAHTLRASADA